MEIAQWLSTQHDDYPSDTIPFLKPFGHERGIMLGEMRFLVNAAHAPGATSDKLAIFLGYLKERQAAIVEINLLLDI